MRRLATIAAPCPTNVVASRHCDKTRMSHSSLHNIVTPIDGVDLATLVYVTTTTVLVVQTEYRSPWRLIREQVLKQKQCC